MSAAADFASGAPFAIHGPERALSPLVFNSPHSGRSYPARFRAQSRLDDIAIRRSEDAYVDELFAGACDSGASLLVAHFPRAYVDVNREANELDPRLFAETLPAQANSRTPRVAGGLGVIPRIVGEGVDIYPGRLALAEAHARIEACYRPYHAALRRLVASAHDAFGAALLIDCHSMPGNIRVAAEAFRPDIVVGDRFGRAASREVSEAAIASLSAMGYRVAHNKPYAGGFITEHYGRPARNVHAVQIEISRALYLDERRIEKSDGFNGLQADMARFAGEMTALAASLGQPAQWAAE
ncbi:MAG: N-formylglutamate amidohydrolase [Phyllobacteriaceae bacterium]|nr:N-formylglutamate amidohydrolase [Phyllobacteriaceae bacterium]